MDLDLRFSQHPYLSLVKTNVYSIPERIREYDSSLFVVFNHKSKRYEIHSTENKGNTYCMTVPFDELDDRILEVIRYNDVRNRGEEIFRAVERAEEERERQKEREFKNWARDVADETHWHFKKQFFHQ